MDAVRSLRVGYPWDLGNQMGPDLSRLRAEASSWGSPRSARGSCRRHHSSLTFQAGCGVPGLPEGVQRGSRSTTAPEYFGPILGIATGSLRRGRGDCPTRSTTGSPGFIPEPRRSRVLAGTHSSRQSLCQPGITGAIVQRQPFGGWKKSRGGRGAKAGGPNYLVVMGSWRDVRCRPLPAP